MTDSAPEECYVNRQITNYKRFILCKETPIAQLSMNCRRTSRTVLPATVHTACHLLTLLSQQTLTGFHRLNEHHLFTDGYLYGLRYVHHLPVLHAGWYAAGIFLCQVRLGLVHVLAEDVHSEGVLRHKHLDEERRYGVSVVKLHIEREDT